MNKFIGGVIISVAVGAVFLLIWWHGHRMGNCESHASLIAVSTGGQNAYIERTLCDGIASSDVVSILISSKDGNKKVAFRFDAASSFVAPEHAAIRVQWASPKELDIYVDQVAYILEQKFQVADVNIKYHIGSVMFRNIPTS